MSEVCESSNVCVGLRSLAPEKSRSSLLENSFSVFGAEESELLRRRMEWSFSDPVNLWVESD